MLCSAKTIKNLVKSKNYLKYQTKYFVEQYMSEIFMINTASVNKFIFCLNQKNFNIYEKDN
jgi:hypothetical protein